MGCTVAAKILGLPADRQERIRPRIKKWVAEEQSLQQLRKARNKSRVSLARKLKIGQDTVSRYERQADVLFSTLQRCVEAVDGKLSLLIEFPNRKPVKIGGFWELSDDSRRRA